MLYREFGKTGFRTSAVGMGTYYDFPWILSARLFGRRANEKGIVSALNAGLDNGLNLIDTAEIYQSEQIISKVIGGRDRESLFIASKAFPTHFRREKLIRACERSLKRLNTKYLDLYQLHFPSRFVPIGETMGAMEELVDRGLIRHIGISNFSYDSMLKAEEALKKYSLASTQMHYNAAHRNVEGTILPHCEENGIALLAYYPVGHGKLANDGSHFASSSARLAKAHNLTSGAQVALTYLISKSECVFPIPRARTAEHVLENTKIGGTLLSREEMDALTSGMDGEASS